MPIYKLMNEIGFERFRIELIEDYPCQDAYQLRQREGHFMHVSSSSYDAASYTNSDKGKDILLEK
jgi:hypothetical protein